MIPSVAGTLGFLEGERDFIVGAAVYPHGSRSRSFTPEENYMHSDRLLLKVSRSSLPSFCRIFGLFKCF